MNLIHAKFFFSENKSLEKVSGSGDNKRLSQKYTAVTPNCQNWLFLRPNTATGASVNPSFKDFAQTKHLSSFDGVTPQNKPSFGEYVGRFLYIPRVNPITLFGRFSQTQNYTGVFSMNAILTILAQLSPVQSFTVGAGLGLVILPFVILTLRLMGV